MFGKSGNSPLLKLCHSGPFLGKGPPPPASYNVIPSEKISAFVNFVNFHHYSIHSGLSCDYLQPMPSNNGLRCHVFPELHVPILHLTLLSYKNSKLKVI
uniref:CSON000562 protein n=1 Tax=Culicoides sonorensis TaxID=179676 RepID=A0A336LUT5_CULSO